MARIVTTHYRCKPPPRKKQAVALFREVTGKDRPP
jgi:hypothetical protein